MPQYTQSCLPYQTSVTHQADSTSTEYQSENSIKHLSNERPLSTEQFGLELNLSLENLAESETYQEIVFLPGSTIDQPATNWDQLIIFPSEAHTQRAITELPTDEAFLEELALLDYRTLPTSKIRQGELNTPVIGKSPDEF